MTSEPARRVKFVFDGNADRILDDSKIESRDQSTDTSAQTKGIRTLVPWSGSELSSNSKVIAQKHPKPEEKKAQTGDQPSIIGIKSNKLKKAEAAIVTKVLL